MKNIKTLAVSLLMVMGISVALVQPAFAASRISGVFVQSACDYQHGPGSTAMSFGDVMSWRCIYNGGWNFYAQGVNLNTECKREHPGLSGVYATYTDFNNAYTWGCYR